MKTHSSSLGTLSLLQGYRQGGLFRLDRLGRVAVLLIVGLFLLGASTGFAKDDSKESARIEAQAESSGDSVAEAATQRININEASGAELEALPGIGPTLAARIIEGRPYEKIEDIKRVKGIGPKTFEKIKERISVK